jgi:uncharacterized protein (DUF58 family)
MKELKLDLKPLLRKAFLISKKDIAGSQDRQTGSGKRQMGSRKTMFGAKGIEFEKFREFAPGDDAGRIDWVASLRAQKMLVRVYSEEQNKDIMFLFDVSSSMSYSSHGKLKNEYAAELVATLAFALSDSGDNIGLVMFTDHIVNFVTPAAGRRQFMKIVREISNPTYYEGDFDLERAIRQFMNYQKKPALVIIVSDFIGLKQGWQDIFETFASSQYEVIGIMIRDPMDDEFPEGHYIGQVVISDPFSSEQLLMDPNRVALKYKAYNKQQVETMRNLFNKTRSTFIVLRTDEPFLEKIKRLFIPVR